MTFNFLHDHWTTVQDYLDGKPLVEVHTVQSLVELIDKQGKQLTDRAVTFLRYSLLTCMLFNKAAFDL